MVHDMGSWQAAQTRLHSAMSTCLMTAAELFAFGKEKGVNDDAGEWLDG